jgi:bisphosphoglycerate-dependent phosphoglycerate mutase
VRISEYFRTQYESVEAVEYEGVAFWNKGITPVLLSYENVLIAPENK